MGIEYLREYLHLPEEIVPATLKKSSCPASRGVERGEGRSGGKGGWGDGGKGGGRDGGYRRGAFGDKPEGGFGGGKGGFGRGGGAPAGLLFGCPRQTPQFPSSVNKLIPG